MYKKLAQQLAGTVDPASVYHYCEEIDRRDRWFSFQHLYETARYLCEEMERLGLEEVEILDAPATGKGAIDDWKQLWAWDADEAVFQVTLPDGTVETVADYRREPCHLVMYSAPTPEEGVTAPLVFVDVGRADEYDAEELRGKLLLCNSGAQGALPHAARWGAAGILAYGGNWNPDLPDAVTWDNTFADKSGLWGHNQEDSSMVAMNVSRTEGERLRRLIEQNGGSLPAFCRVRTRFHEGTFPTPTGVLRGTDKAEEVIILTGHPFENGATDNATGCAIRLEVMRALTQLIDSGALPQPRRSIRLLFPLEGPGSVDYAQRREEELRKLICALELDCVGEDWTITRNPWGISLTPWALPSWLDGLILKLLDDYLLGQRGHYFTWWKVPCYHVIGHGGGNDGRLVALRSRAPAVRFAAANYLWHLSADTMAAVSAENMAHCAVVIGTAAYFIANAGEREACWLAEVAATYSECELARAAQREIDALMDNGATPEQVRDAKIYLDFLCKRELRGLRDVLRLTRGEDASEPKGAVQASMLCLRREGMWHKLRLEMAVGVDPAPPAPLSDLEKKMEKIVPRNLLYSDPRHLVRLPADQRLASAGTLGSLLEWFDGKRTLLECVRSYALTFRRPGEAIKTLDEIGKMLHPDLGLWDYLNLLREYGYVAW